MEPSYLNNMRTAVILIYICWSAGVYVCPVQADSNVLNAIVLETITFGLAVKDSGFIYKSGNGIAKVVNDEAHFINNSYGVRLQWDHSSGLFSIIDLKREDSGEYRVEDHHDNQRIYQLTVWDPVSRPRVSSRNKMNPTCSVLCSVQNGREVILSWQRDGKTLSHTSSPDLSTLLSLPLAIEYNSAPYSCVVKNPARNETVIVKPEEYCLVSVSKPRIRSSAGYGGGCCSLLCSVQNGREVTLSWQIEGETLSHTSSPDLRTPLSLPLDIAESNITYYCVAKNPGSEERTVFHPSALCMEEGNRTRDVVGYIMFVLRLVEFVLVTLAVGLLLHMYRVGRVLPQHR
ncbi:hypothetical protein AAFF_G00265280 [Aldrovandia affinis]|uniref:Ig-like domain-containing protein n=1 Tax=Aldrovandia affinis TaxID=143900 RepID=A0AAD7RBI1_9TELE|nr:hypothetical protein AAFF_G00265280 [Aldrovandia affinis]